MYICLQIIFLIIFLTACYNPNNNNVIIPVNFLCGRKPEETGEPRGNGRKLGNPEKTGGNWGTRRKRGNPERTHDFPKSVDKLFPCTIKCLTPGPNL